MPYHPFADLLDTYQSLAVLVQVLWIVVPPAFVTGMFGLWLNYRLKSRGVERSGEVFWGKVGDLLEIEMLRRELRPTLRHPGRGCEPGSIGPQRFHMRLD